MYAAYPVIYEVLFLITDESPFIVFYAFPVTNVDGLESQFPNTKLVAWQSKQV
jgi:hypothetical protein